MFKPIKINFKNKIIKLNNLILSTSSIGKNFTSLLYSFDFRNGINNNLPSNVMDIVFYSKNGINKNLFDSIKTMIQSLIDKKNDNVDQKIIISFLSKTNLLNNPYSLKIQVNQNTFIEKQFILTEQNKFLPVFITINCSELPNLDSIDRFNLIIDNSLEIKNLLVYEFDNYEPKLLISFPHKISNVLFSPFGFQTLKKLKIISDFTLLDTLDFWELQRYMDFTPPNGQSPTYSRYITVKDENTIGTQYNILYQQIQNLVLNNYEFQNVEFKQQEPYIRQVKQYRDKRYKVKLNIKKIQDDPLYNQNQYLFYQGFTKNNNIKTNTNIGFGSNGIYNWYPVMKTSTNIPNTFETWVSPTFGYNTSRPLPNFVYFHSVGTIINYQWPYNNINQKFQVNSLEIFEVDENDNRIDVTPLIQVNNPLLYYLYLPLIKQEPMFNKSFIDIMYDSEFHTNETILKYENTIPPLLSEYREDQIHLDRTIKFYYNQEKQEFKFQSTNDFVLIKNVKNTYPNYSYFHFKLMSTDQTDVVVDFLDSNNNIIHTITINITDDYTYLYIPISIYLNTDNNISFIKITSTVPTTLTIKDLKQIEVINSRLPLSYLTDNNVLTYDYILSTDNILKRGIDWLTTFYGLDVNSITNNSFEQLILTQNGIHIFKRNLDNLKQGTKYTFYSWIKNNYPGVTHQIMTHDDQNYTLLSQTKITEHDGWELIKTEFTPDRDVNCSYMIFRDHNNYSTDVFISGFSVFENTYEIPLLNSPSQCYQDSQYLEFSDIFLPLNFIFSLTFSHYKFIQDNKSVWVEFEDINNNSLQLFVKNNNVYYYTNESSSPVLINNITMDENKIYNLEIVNQNDLMTIKIIDKESNNIIFNESISHSLTFNNLTKVRLGDSKYNLTDYYSFNFINVNISLI